MRVERKKGEWLQENITRGGTGANQYQELKSTGTTLADIGLSRDESSKAQRIAALSPEKFEEYIEEAKDTNKEITLSGAVKLEAIRIIARQSRQSLEVQNRIAEYRLRVERKKGEWLQENITRGQGATLMSTDLTLTDIGLSRNESSPPEKSSVFCHHHQ